MDECLYEREGERQIEREEKSARKREREGKQKE